MNMILEIVMMILWGSISISLAIMEEISLEYVYIGMCIMLAAELLHEEK